jgi:hypothetical protein
MTARRLAAIFLALGALGFVLLVLGVALIYPPAAVVLAGASLLSFAAFGLSREIGAAR